MRPSPATFLVLAFAAACAPPDPDTARSSPGLDSVIGAEREFAAASVRDGPRSAFLQYFDDSVVTFGPAPGTGTDQLRAGADFGPLEWEPEIAEISAAGDLGYTSGPWHSARADGSVAWGHYVSVWRRQEDGAWRVVLDMGVPHDEAEPVADVERPHDPSGSVRLVIRSSALELMARDRAYQAAYRRRSRPAALTDFTSERLRAYRSHALPFRGRAAADSDQAARHEAMDWTPAGAGIAASGDLGFTYGSGSMTRDDLGGGSRAFSYTRIWRRDTTGTWRVVLEMVVPHPAN